MAYYDWERLFRLIQKLNLRMSLRDACSEMGVSYTAYHAWRKRKLIEGESNGSLRRKSKSLR